MTSALTVELVTTGLTWRNRHGLIVAERELRAEPGRIREVIKGTLPADSTLSCEAARHIRDVYAYVEMNARILAARDEPDAVPSPMASGARSASASTIACPPMG